MKRNTTLLHLASVAVVCVFIALSIGSLGGSLIGELFSSPWEFTSEREEDGTKTETTLTVDTAQQYVNTKTGKTDMKGRWHGPYTREMIGVIDTTNAIYKRKLTINMVNGKKHGIGIQVWYISEPPYNKTDTICFNMDVLVNCDQFRRYREDNSAYDILKSYYGYYWFDLLAFNYQDGYIKSYMDTLELIINSYDPNILSFDDYYSDALEELEETHYDSLTKDNSDFTIFNLLEYMKDGQFRLAVFDRYLKGVNSLFSTFTEYNPGYLNWMDSLEISRDDFEQYCFVFDSVMNQYDPLDIEHYAFPDRMDERIFRVFSAIDSLHPEGIIADVNFAVALFSFGEFLYKADIIKLCLREAYFQQHDFIDLPVVTTFVKSQSSDTEAEIEGFVVNNGGADVTNRGILWAQQYNPTMDDNQLSAGAGTGLFEVTISNLTPGETYFARSFATNSAGTNFGNCVEFIAQQLTGSYEINSPAIQVKLFPNPASSTLNIRYDNEFQQIEEIRSFDISGKQVSTNYDMGISILDVSHLSAGMYHIHIVFSDGHQAVRKIVVER